MNCTQRTGINVLLSYRKVILSIRDLSARHGWLECLSMHMRLNVEEYVL